MPLGDARKWSSFDNPTLLEENIRAADRWRGISVGEFEQRQLRAIREELNRTHAPRVASAVTVPKPTAVRKLRSWAERHRHAVAYTAPRSTIVAGVLRRTLNRVA
jgi:hypothetical protein